jgi:RimJ/RimL family protein N-acetyltransferase
MTLHQGDRYREGLVSIGIPNPERIGQALIAEDVAQEVAGSLAWALQAEDVYYFSIYDQEALVGQIFLHDIDWQAGTGMIGYHLFQPSYRGQGIGTKSLGLLQQFVLEATELKQLVIITGEENIASRRMAEKCGFEYIGKAREDAMHVVYQWEVREEHGLLG